LPLTARAESGSGGLLRRSCFNEPALSPDGQRVAMNNNSLGDQGDIWILELARGTFTRFTFEPHIDRRPIWSPDGSRIVFSSDRNGVDELYQRLSSGAGSDQLFLHGGMDQNILADDWSSDGRFIIYNQEISAAGTSGDLWILPLEGDRKPYPFLQTRFNETHAQFSPDVKWVAYVSDESGQAEVYVQSFPASGGQMADINRRGRSSAMAARWERTLLLERRQKAHGSSSEDGSDFRERNTGAVVSDASHADKFNGRSE
jgi:Tol biopolymer transport system component